MFTIASGPTESIIVRPSTRSVTISLSILADRIGNPLRPNPLLHPCLIFGRGHLHTCLVVWRENCLTASLTHYCLLIVSERVERLGLSPSLSIRSATNRNALLKERAKLICHILFREVTGVRFCLNVQNGSLRIVDHIKLISDPPS